MSTTPFETTTRTSTPHVTGHVITLCGSTRFKGYFELANRYLTLAGNTVFSVGHFPHQEKEAPSVTTKNMLDEIHRHKIWLSHSIFVINPGGYIGLSTWRGIKFADKECKNVYFLDWESGIKLGEDIKNLPEPDPQTALETIADLITFSFDDNLKVIPGSATRLRELGKLAAGLGQVTGLDILRKHPLELGFKL